MRVSATCPQHEAVARALDGVSVTVGSKDFTENILLGEMLVQVLENEGASVTKPASLITGFGNRVVKVIFCDAGSATSKIRAQIRAQIRAS